MSLILLRGRVVEIGWRASGTGTIVSRYSCKNFFPDIAPEARAYEVMRPSSQRRTRLEHFCVYGHAEINCAAPPIFDIELLVGVG